MAFRFNELPVVLQILIYFIVAVGLFLAFEFLDFSPVKQAADRQAEMQSRLARLTAEVARLQAVKQQHQEFLTRLEALEEQLTRLQAFVPEKKSVDEFMRTLQGASSGAQVALRSLRSRAVVVKGQIAEMPFEVELDGGYYDVSNFFDRLGKTSRIINSTALTLSGLGSGTGGGHKFNYRAGTTVTGNCTVTTFYTPSEAELAAAAPPGRGRGGRGRGGRRQGGR